MLRPHERGCLPPIELILRYAIELIDADADAASDATPSPMFSRRCYCR
jgi:hypothetical protein